MVAETLKTKKPTTNIKLLSLPRRHNSAKGDNKYKAPTTRLAAVAVAGVVCACASRLWPVCGAGGGKQRWSRAYTRPTLLLLLSFLFLFLNLYFLQTWVPFERGTDVGEGLEEQSGSLTGR